MKVNFKIVSLDSQNGHVIAVNPAWAVKDLTIPLKHTRLSRSLEEWPHLQEVRFPEVERKKISILLGTNIQEAFVLRETETEMNHLQSSLVLVGAYSVAPQMYSPTARDRLTSSVVNISP